MKIRQLFFLLRDFYFLRFLLFFEMSDLFGFLLFHICLAFVIFLIWTVFFSFSNCRFLFSTCLWHVRLWHHLGLKNKSKENEDLCVPHNIDQNFLKQLTSFYCIPLTFTYVLFQKIYFRTHLLHIQVKTILRCVIYIG